MLEIIVIIALAVALLWVRSARRAYRIRRTERLRLRALNPPRYGRRAATWVLRRTFSRRFLWHPPTGRTAMIDPCPVARRGLWRTVKIRIDQHLLVAGLTGSGKSSTCRVLADWALRAGARVILVDLKPGAPEGALYEGRAEVITSAAGLVTRVRELLANPPGGRIATVIIVDEMATLVRQLSEKQLDEFASLMDVARIYGISIWCAVQHPSRETVPSKIQANIQAVICHKVRSKIESDVIFHDPEWRPDQLRTPGDVLVQEGKRGPDKLRALWLSPERFKLSAECLTPHLDPESGRNPDPVETNAPPGAFVDSSRELCAPPVELTANQELVAMALEIEGRALTAKAIAEGCDLPANRTHEALAALVGKGIVSKLPDRYPALFQLAPAHKELS
ncbi:type IV secretory system conjugative DNA transfer family protein [Streptomyces albicerus]|uniref:type IV secretory system conjugative DNA transfer family protein n=1 Tax=Streptomyces albicerus TaxID=2569859 RepID=UPI00124BC3C3|nr:type IV secretory system conjugative DNA transfer family protein [Streptomyces albicerus]